MRSGGTDGNCSLVAVDDTRAPPLGACIAAARARSRSCESLICDFQLEPLGSHDAHACIIMTRMPFLISTGAAPGRRSSRLVMRHDMRMHDCMYVIMTHAMNGSMNRVNTALPLMRGYCQARNTGSASSTSSLISIRSSERIESRVAGMSWSS